MPSQNVLSLTIELEPMPAPRPRVSKRGTYYPNRYVRWKKTAITLIRAKLGANRLNLPTPLDAFIVFEAKGKRGDLDNYIKATLDAVSTATGINDRAFVAIMAWWKTTKTPPRIHIILRHHSEENIHNTYNAFLGENNDIQGY